MVQATTISSLNKWIVPALSPNFWPCQATVYFQHRNQGDSVKREVRPPRSSARIPPMAPYFTQSQSQSLPVIQKACRVGPPYPSHFCPCPRPLSLCPSPIGLLAIPQTPDPLVPVHYLLASSAQECTFLFFLQGFTQRCRLKEPFSGQPMNILTSYINPIIIIAIIIFVI